MIKLKTFGFISIFILLQVAGCRSMTPIDPRITIIDDYFFPDLIITEVKEMPNCGSFMEIQVTGINDSSSYHKLEYKIDWLDHNGMLIPNVISGWTKFSGFENSEFRFKAVAPTMNAKDFRILIRKEN